MSEKLDNLSEHVKQMRLRLLAQIALSEARRKGTASFTWEDTEITVDRPEGFRHNQLDIETEILKMEDEHVERTDNL